VERAKALKQGLKDFVLDAEGAIAIALETFSADQSSRSYQSELHQRNWVVDRFLLEGIVGDSTPIQLFLEQSDAFAKSDRALLQSWHRAFIGLFEIVQVLPDGFQLLNWTTAKQYRVKPIDPHSWQTMTRLKVGEILLTQIAPLTDDEWIFFSGWTSLGKLGKPKLAVAIGNFKKAYPAFLYSDAPELVEEAWRSVEHYHQDFLDFFGSDEITLPGYQFSKKLAEFQTKITQKQAKSAGLDESLSLAELAEKTGTSKDDIASAAETLGVDTQAIAQIFDPKAGTKMVAPQIELPAHLKQADQVTALTHPQWGQIFLTTYQAFKTLLERDDWQTNPNTKKQILQHLENVEMNSFVWHRLATQYPKALQSILQFTLQRPEFKLSQDLDSLLIDHKKPLEPMLPEIASVPLHLHELFQDAVLDVSKDRSKSKVQPPKSGFGLKK
jgi:hypothetical protein